MVTKLFVPERRIVVPKPPSYLKLDMAFAIGAGAKLMDKSRYRSHGTISGASWATGLHGKALDFNKATPDYVETSTTETTQLNFTSEDFSIIMRFKADAITPDAMLFMRGADALDGYLLFHHAAVGIVLRTYQAGTNQQSFVGTALVAGNWYTIGMSRQGTSVLIFQNGIDSTGTKGTHLDPTTSARTVKIGIDDDKASSGYDGKIEFLRIFGGIALPASAHLAWHNALA